MKTIFKLHGSQKTLTVDNSYDGVLFTVTSRAGGVAVKLSDWGVHELINLLTMHNVEFVNKHKASIKNRQIEITSIE